MARNSSPTAPLRRARCETVNPLHVLSHSPVSYDTIPPNHSGYEFLIPILQSSKTAPGSRMALQPHPRSPIPQSRAHGSPPPPHAEHRPSGSDADPFANEGRETSRAMLRRASTKHGQTTPIPTTEIHLYGRVVGITGWRVTPYALPALTTGTHPARHSAYSLSPGCQAVRCCQVICRAVGQLSGIVRCLCQTSCQVLSVLSGAVGCLSDIRGAP